MRRGDRLFRLVQLLRRGRVMTAEAIAEELEVSPRTVYRDIADLMAARVPIEGERGVGYVLRPGYDLPPLMFSRDEIEALLLGVQIVMGSGDEGLARAAEDAQTKIRAVLPPTLAAFAKALVLFAPEPAPRPEFALPPQTLRPAIRERRKLMLAYVNGAGEQTERVVWPLALAYFGTLWVLCGWCELRGDFRNFRLDRIVEGWAIDTRYPVMPGRRLADYLAQQKATSGARRKPCHAGDGGSSRRISQLPNLGAVTERQLAEVGVRNELDLRAIGAVGAWHRLKFAFADRITLVGLYALAAAVRNMPWTALSAAERAALRRAAAQSSEKP